MLRPSQKRRRKRAVYRVFVSHATADKWLARTLCEKIEGVGATTFRDDRDIDGGEDIPDAIRAAVNECREMVVVLPPSSVGRPWVLMEVGAAWLRGDQMRVVAVRQQIDVQPIPAMLHSEKIIDLNQFDEYLDELRVRVNAVR